MTEPLSRDVIFGTDWYTDCDDCVAARVLARLSKQGMVNVLGVAVNACNRYTASSLGAFLESEGLGDIEIGIDTKSNKSIGIPTYHMRLSKMPSKYRKNSDCIAAVSLYRKCLAGARGRVDIIEVGFLQVLEQLLKSEPDEYSPLGGTELVKQKAGRLWSMAGDFSKPQGGKEYNLCGTGAAKKGAAYVFDNWPGEIIMLGFEVGEKVITGSKLPQDDILALALKDHLHPQGRSSWDPMTVLLACTGNEEKAGYSTVTGTMRVDPDSGANYFTRDPGGRHKYVVKLHGDEWYAGRIDAIIA